MKNKAYFGDFGGRFIPETLSGVLSELENAFSVYWKDAGFKKELALLLRDYAGRPTPLYFAKNLSSKYGCKIYLKREDLLHTGAHKINNALAQGLLAKRMGKKRIIAETGAGQHGVATATACALLGLECHIFMGSIDIKRQAPNVKRMRILGAEIIPVESGSKVLKDAVNEALRDWVSNARTTYYLLGSAVGPYPYPLMVREFQSVIGKEAKRQVLAKEGRLPDYVLACVGGGSNAIGMFHPFFKHKQVKLIGVEAAGEGLNKKHAASLVKGSVGILHGAKSYLLQDEDGQIQEAYSIAPGLDYPGVGPEHAWYKRIKRAQYVAISDKKALTAMRKLSVLEGIIPAIESSHAIAYLDVLCKEIRKGSIILVCLSGRGDKDLEFI